MGGVVASHKGIIFSEWLERIIHNETAYRGAGIPRISASDTTPPKGNSLNSGHDMISAQQDDRLMKQWQHAVPHPHVREPQRQSGWKPGSQNFLLELRGLENEKVNQ